MQSWLYAIIGLILGLIIGFFAARYFFKQQLKKNPPINENQIRAMLQQMGQSPSEKRVRQIMKAMNEAK